MMDILDLLDILLTIVIISLYCNGVYYLVNKQYGNLLSFIDEWYEKGRKRKHDKIKARYKAEGIEGIPHPPKYYDSIIKPIWGCIYCMPSFWTLVIYPLLHNVNMKSAIEIPIIMICCIAMNVLIYKNSNL